MNDRGCAPWHLQDEMIEIKQKREHKAELQRMKVLLLKPPLSLRIWDCLC